MERPATRTILAAVAAGVLTVAGPAAAKPFGTQPPSGASRAALTAAFWKQAPRERTKIRLLGFREWENDPVAAAFFLTRGGPDGGYADGGEEYFRRAAGGHWNPTRHLHEDDKDNLSPLYLFDISSTGTGSDVRHSTTATPDDEAATGADVVADSLSAQFSWNLAFGPRAGPVDVDFPGGFPAPGGLTGTLSSTHTDSTDTTQNLACTGTLRDTSDSENGPVLAARDENRDAQIDFSIEMAADATALTETWAPTAQPLSADASCPSLMLSTERLVSAVRVAKTRFAPRPGSERTVTSFSVPFDSTAPGLAKTIEPHQSNTDGAATSTEDLAFSGRLTFTLKGMLLPHGLLGAADDPPYEGN